MNILTVSLMMACNRDCYYCPTKNWHSDDVGVNIITAAALFKWVKKYIPPVEWTMEFTGGEPAMHPEITRIITVLSNAGYHGVIKTNGSLFIPKTGNFIRAAAWHEDADFPKHYDQILIIRNPNDDWQAKVDYCKQNNITYKTSIFDEYYLTRQPIMSAKQNKCDRYCHINSNGQITACNKDPVKEDINIFNMSAPVFKNVKKECPTCKNISDVEMFVS